MGLCNGDCERGNHFRISGKATEGKSSVAFFSGSYVLSLKKKSFI